jgi:Fuc2NAc and GlcNAc transferase
MASLLVICVVAGVASWLLTGRVRRAMVARGALDVPNERSSHTVPTPRGGGLAVAAVVLPAIAAAALLGWLPAEVGIALAGGGAMVAAVGWLDDCFDLHARPRLLVHFAAAAWALAWLGGLPRLHLGELSVPLGAAGWAIAALGIVWAVNFYNFMDGIDGIAGGEAVVVGAGAGVLLLVGGAGGLASVAFLIAAAAAGFLVWNWAPARIFMGDVGSGLIGFLFAVLAIASENAGVMPLLVWVLLLGVFVVDATVTLVRRALDGETIFNAHRKHAYQRAVQAGWSHARVSAAVMALGFVLTLLGYAALRLPHAAVPLVVAGIGALVLLHTAVLLWASAAKVARRADELRPEAVRRAAASEPAPGAPAFHARSAVAYKRGRGVDSRI